MGRYEKALAKLLNRDAVLLFKELEYILGKLGYKEKKTGKTSGSRKAYINKELQHIIRLHKPHPGNKLKKYTKDYIIKELKRMNLI